MCRFSNNTLNFYEFELIYNKIRNKNFNIFIFLYYFILIKIILKVNYNKILNILKYSKTEINNVNKYKIYKFWNFYLNSLILYFWDLKIINNNNYWLNDNNNK